MNNNTKMPPLPPRKLFVPIEFWSEIMLNLDKRVEVVTNDFGFGEIGLIIKIHKEKVMEVEFSDKIRVRNIISKAGIRGNDSAPQGTDSTLKT